MGLLVTDFGELSRAAEPGSVRIEGVNCKHYHDRMSKRPPKKPIKSLKRTDPSPWLRKALAKRTKNELIDILVETAVEDRTVLRRLAAHFELQTPLAELLAQTRQAIADATAFDERDINRNFSYDSEAYGQVQRNLRRLVELGQLRPAMELALELMQQGSYQVEASWVSTDKRQSRQSPSLSSLRYSRSRIPSPQSRGCRSLPPPYDL